MKIVPLSHDSLHLFESLFLPYFLEITQTDPSPLPPDIITGKLLPFIAGQWDQGIIRIDLCMAGGLAVGFAIYQLDTPESDWCKRPGWGFIREFCVVPECRKAGLGRALAAHALESLRDMGAASVYLTSDSAVDFWLRCGFTDETPQNPDMHTLVIHL